MANPAEKEVRRKSVDDVKVNLLRPSLTSYFAVQIPLPTNDGKETDLSRRLREVLGADQGQLNLLCTDTSLPGSQLTTMDINNDRTGVTEKHAYRRMFDDRIDFTFYVDASNYLPIRFFETWMKGIMNEDEGVNMDKSYNYRPTYPDEYTADQGLKIFKFERDYQQFMTYEFIRSFPLSISSMPVSYSGNDLLKCTVSMSYIRYIQSGPNNNIPVKSSGSKQTPAQNQEAQNLSTGTGSYGLGLGQGIMGGRTLTRRDIQGMRNQGASEAEIRRIQLAVGDTPFRDQ